MLNFTKAIDLMLPAKSRRLFASKFEKLKLSKKLHLSFLPPLHGWRFNENPFFRKLERELSLTAKPVRSSTYLDRSVHLLSLIDIFQDHTNFFIDVKK